MELIQQLGLVSLFEDGNYFQDMVQSMLKTPETINGYYGKYHRKNRGDVEMIIHSFHVEGNRHGICGFSTGVSGNHIWRLTVAEVGYLDESDDGRNDYLNRTVKFTNPVHTDMKIPIHLVYADVAPDFDVNDVYDMQVVAVADNVTYFPDKATYDSKPYATTFEGFKLNFAYNDIANMLGACVATGEVKRVGRKTTYDSKEEPVELYAVEIETSYGILEIVHSKDAVEGGGLDMIKPGAVIRAFCTVLGNVAVGEYQHGAVLDQEHIVRLFRDCFYHGDFTRAYEITAEDSRLIMADGETAEGPDPVLHRLCDYMDGLDPDVTDFCLGRVTEAGTPCVLAVDNGVITDAFFIGLNTDNKVSEIREVVVNESCPYKFIARLHETDNE